MIQHASPAHAAVRARARLEQPQILVWPQNRLDVCRVLPDMILPRAEVTARTLGHQLPGIGGNRTCQSASIIRLRRSQNHQAASRRSATSLSLIRSRSSAASRRARGSCPGFTLNGNAFAHAR